ncbi:MAG: pentapeptide repeat-containing protein [Cyanobacteria bacterium P01_D01_bin.1]
MNHSTVLAQGIEHWNKWRSHHANIACTLADADLHRGHFIGGNFRYVDLKGANLRQANLKHADLTGANLTGADLTGADLTGTNLTSSCLDSAIFYEANLSSANLARAVLDKTDLRSANLTHTGLVDADIRSVKLTGLSDSYASEATGSPIASFPATASPTTASSAASPIAVPSLAAPVLTASTTHVRKIRSFRPSSAIPAFIPTANAFHLAKHTGCYSRFMSRLSAFIYSDRESDRGIARFPAALRQRIKRTKNAGRTHQIELTKGKFYIL